MTASAPEGYLRFIVRNPRLLAFGFVMAFLSSFGQTYFVGVFTPNIEAAFGLSHTEWGVLYMIGTLLSAALLPFTSRWIDRVSVRRFALVACCGAVVACAFFALTPAVWALVPIIFLLRQMGQGLVSHTAVTGMVKFYDQNRGKAVAVASLGFPAGRAILPIAAVTAIALIGWRGTYLVCALIAVVLTILVAWLLGGRGGDAERAQAVAEVPGHGLRDVLRDPVFYLLVPGIFAPAFLETALNFHQLTVAALKSWSPEWVTGGYMIFGAMMVLSSIGCGGWADRLGSARLLPLALLPLSAGVLVVAYFDHPIWAWVYLGFFGFSSGMMATLLPLMLSELYGTRHIGAIRGFAWTLTVFGSALAPPTMGWALDAGVSLPAMAWVGSAYVFAASALFWRACRESG